MAFFSWQPGVSVFILLIISLPIAVILFKEYSDLTVFEAVFCFFAEEIDSFHVDDYQPVPTEVD